MPTPVPDHVTEAWLLPAEVIRNYLNSDYHHYGGGDSGGYAKSLTLKARNKAAVLLYEHLSEQQVESLRNTGKFAVGEVVISCASAFHSRSEHPGLSFSGSEVTCISYGGGVYHELLPMCDRLLALKLHVELNNIKTYQDFLSHTRGDD